MVRACPTRSRARLAARLRTESRRALGRISRSRPNARRHACRRSESALLAPTFATHRRARVPADWVYASEFSDCADRGDAGALRVARRARSDALTAKSAVKQ